MLYDNLLGKLLFNYTGASGSIAAVVISPVIAQMVDQKANFMHKGIMVEFVGDAQDS